MIFINTRIFDLRYTVKKTYFERKFPPRGQLGRIFIRVVPDTDFEPGYPGFENPDSDPAGYPVFSIGFLIFFHMHS